jgi:hypothetical protein
MVSLDLGKCVATAAGGEAGPQHKLSVLDGLIPGGLCGETGCRVVVLYELRLCLQLVNVVDDFRWWGALK